MTNQDILFEPTNPISALYHVTPQTLLGLDWCERYCISRLAYSLRDLRQLTARAEAQGLIFKIDWSIAISSVA